VVWAALGRVGQLSMRTKLGYRCLACVGVGAAVGSGWADSCLMARTAAFRSETRAYKRSLAALANVPLMLFFGTLKRPGRAGHVNLVYTSRATRAFISGSAIGPVLQEHFLKSKNCAPVSRPRPLAHSVARRTRQRSLVRDTTVATVSPSASKRVPRARTAAILSRERALHSIARGASGGRGSPAAAASARR